MSYLRTSFPVLLLLLATKSLRAQSDDGNWPYASKDYSGQRFSQLDQINTDNVKTLQVAWTFGTGVNRGHEAAPGPPMIPFLKVLPARRSQSLARFSNRPPWRMAWSFVSNAYVAWFLHLIALWIWHIPALFDATPSSELVHTARHVSFLGSALLFWWAVIHAPRRAEAYGMAVLYIFSTAMHSGLLGVLITFASQPMYQSYTFTTQACGLSPLEDQQLGGLIMWIPAGIVYVLAGLLFIVGWMRESERRVLRWEKGVA